MTPDQMIAARSWVVEVNEVLLNSTGAQDRAQMQWWAVHSGRPGIAARTIYLAIVPVGALLYVRCNDEDEARWLHDYLAARLNPKGLAVRQIGVPVKCAGCGEKRPFWATARRIGRRCHPCWTQATRFADLQRQEAMSHA